MDKLVNVPVCEEDIANTISLLPRTPGEAGIIPIKLKRKKEYKNTHKEEYVSVPKIKAALKTLKHLGHKYYQFVKEEDVDSFENRCNDLSDEDFSYIFGGSESAQDVLDTTAAEAVMDIGDDLQKSEDDELILKDSVAKFQFDYHANTCFANDVPEISVNENEAPKAISIAPGEGKVPKDILQDKDWDMRAFPALDPTGENSLNCQRTVKLTYQQFFQQRIFNIDR